MNCRDARDLFVILPRCDHLLPPEPLHE